MVRCSTRPPYLYTPPKQNTAYLSSEFVAIDETFQGELLAKSSDVAIGACFIRCHREVAVNGGRTSDVHQMPACWSVSAPPSVVHRDRQYQPAIV